MAKIALIVGSVRQERQGIKVARWMEEKLKNRNHVVFFIDPIELKLPLSRKVPVGLRVLSFILRFFRLILAPIFESLRGVPPSFKEIILLDQELN